MQIRKRIQEAIPMQIQTDLDSGQTFESKNVEFIHEKILKVPVGNTVGQKTYLGRYKSLFEKFGQFPCPDPR
jgi:hypothetical protein